VSLAAPAISSRKIETAEAHVAQILEANGFGFMSELYQTVTAQYAREMVHAVVQYVVLGSPTNGADVYFERTQGLTDVELKIISCIPVGVKLALDDVLDHDLSIVIRIEHVEGLLKGRCP